MSDQDNTLAPTDTTSTDTSTDSVELSELGAQLQFENEENGGENQESPVDRAESPADTTETKPDESQTPEDTQTPEKKDESQQDQPVETEAERNRRFYEERQQQKRIRDQIKSQIDESYTPQNQEELEQHYLDQGYDDFQAKVLAREDRREQEKLISEASNQISDLNTRIDTEALQVFQDFPEFYPGTPERPNPQFDKDLAAKAAKAYKRYSGEVRDPKTGLVVDIQVTPYEFYKDFYDTWSSGQAKAKVVAQRNVEQQVASTTPPSSTAPIRTVSTEDKEANEFAEALKNVV